ncbi:NAD(P)H-dependent oxidoreductase [Nocardiopsis sp. NPDC050513]|uniref:NAD(P)H-dependent oxidoreductase n=1 Tax=Nocardiopsis sp. NPDC050513 TaxID=3364338 RepID=UPI003793D02D
MTDTTPRGVLIVTAHPEPRSLTDTAARRLRAAGHRVRVSDLYAMKWKAGVDADDYPDRDPSRPLDVLADSGTATRQGRLTRDVAAEQAKVNGADAVILQFPMRWFSVPAVLKGWIDRVFTYEWAHGPSVPPPPTPPKAPWRDGGPCCRSPWAPAPRPSPTGGSTAACPTCSTPSSTASPGSPA